VFLYRSWVSPLSSLWDGIILITPRSALTGLPILGALKDADGDRFRGVIIFSGCVLILGAFLIGVARVAKFGKSVKLKV
jgi:hypothetical protein